jgi:hypothetical protein
MWKPQRLTTLWAFTACYRDSFTSYTALYTGRCNFEFHVATWNRMRMLEGVENDLREQKMKFIQNENMREEWTSFVKDSEVLKG